MMTVMTDTATKDYYNVSTYCTSVSSCVDNPAADRHYIVWRSLVLAVGIKYLMSRKGLQSNLTSWK